MSAGPARKATWSLQLWWDLIVASFPDDETSQPAFPSVSGAEHSHTSSPLYFPYETTACSPGQRNSGILMLPEETLTKSNSGEKGLLLAGGYSLSLQGSRSNRSSRQLVTSIHSPRQREKTEAMAGAQLAFSALTRFRTQILGGKNNATHFQLGFSHVSEVKQAIPSPGMAMGQPG